MEYLGAAVGGTRTSCDPAPAWVTPAADVTPELDSLDVLDDLEMSDTFDFFLDVSLLLLAEVLAGPGEARCLARASSIRLLLMARS